MYCVSVRVREGWVSASVCKCECVKLLGVNATRSRSDRPRKVWVSVCMWVSV